jgi:peptide/nickel transport system substrate-binding protein
MKKRFLLVLSLIVIAGFFLIGSGPVFGAPSGTLRCAVAEFAYESMDPIQFESFWGWALYDPLLTFDPKGNIVGAAAESYKLSPDGKTWTFKIRKGMKFHNGDPVTAQDVAFSVARFSSKESTNPWSPYLRNNFESMETPDQNTFIYHAAKPEPALAVPFAWTRILPKNYIEKNGVENFRKNPIGSGPWKFSKFVSKTSMEMVGNTQHWRQVPAFEKYIEYMVPEESTRVAMLKRGDVDIVAPAPSGVSLSFDRIVELKKDGFRLQEVGLPTLTNFNFSGTWLTQGPTSDKRVRQAMSYSINRQELSDTFYKGFGKPGGRWFMDEVTWGWDPKWKADAYDVNKAKALLKEAGYPGKFKDPIINIFCQAPHADLMQALAGYWEAAGIQTKINITDANTQGGYMFVRHKDASVPIVGGIWPWVGGGFFNNVYHSSNMFKSTGVHTTGNDPKADEMYDKAVAELDAKKARKMWTDFMNYGYDMWVNVGVVKIPQYAVVGPKVGEFSSLAYMSVWDSLAGIKRK